MKTSIDKRNAHLMRLAVTSGDRLFDPFVGLLKQEHPTHKRYTGYTVAQQSLEYAIALFETCGDHECANAIIQKTMTYQDRDSRSPTYGNFIWMSHWNAVEDRNAVSFMVPNYAYLWQKHKSKLQAETVKSLEEMFPLALRGTMNHRVPASYTNIFLLNILSMLLLSDILNDQAALDAALCNWNGWIEEVSLNGIAEYNSPCYTAVDIYALEGILEASPTEEFRRQAARMLEYLWIEFCVNYHAGAQCLTGPMSRAYPSDNLYGSGLSAVLAYQQFGIERKAFDTNGDLTPFVVNFAVRDYVVPDHILKMALEKTYPLTVSGKVPSKAISWTNYLHHNFAVGSQTGRYGPQEIPVFVAYRTVHERRTVFFKSDPPVTLVSSQEANAILGGFYYPTDMDSNRYHEARTISPTVFAQLGPKKVISSVKTPGWNPDNCQLQLEHFQDVAVDLDSVLVGIRPFMVSGSCVELAGRILLGEQDGELRITWRMEEGLVHGTDTDSPVAGFFLVVVDKTVFCDLGSFAEHLERYDCSCCRGSDGIRLVAEGNGLSLSVDIPPGRPGQVDFLHSSSYLLLRPGELKESIVKDHSVTTKGK